MADVEQYRAVQQAIWDDFAARHHAFVDWWQVEVGAKNDGVGPIDESQFREPMNRFVDELLTHLPPESAAGLARDLPQGWGREGEVILYFPYQEMETYIGLSQPEIQWGGPLPDGVTSDPQKWETHLRGRLKLLGAGVDRAFGPEVVPGLDFVPISEGVPDPTQGSNTSPWFTVAKIFAVTGLAGLAVGLAMQQYRDD